MIFLRGAGKPEIHRGEIDLLQVEKCIRGRVKRQMEKSQREYYLNEQSKAIQKESGEMDEGLSRGRGTEKDRRRHAEGSTRR